MAIYPGGTFRPTGWGGKTARRTGQRGILHVAVSNATDLPPWNGNTWHFYVNRAGQAFQYVDTAWCAWASVDANADAISIETQGGMGTSAQLNAEQWTAPQAARIADIMRWVHATEGTPIQALPDSLAGRRGWGTHRLGINPWRVPGGQVWSNSNGKECPGNAKVAQLPSIIQLALQGDDMPLTQADANLVVNTLLSTLIKPTAGPDVGNDQPIKVVLREAFQNSQILKGMVASLPDGSAQVDAKALAAAIVANMPAVQAQQVAAAVIAGLDGARLNTSPPA